MTENNEQITDLDGLNKRYYRIFNELKNARPALANCDGAFLSMVQNITEKYLSDSKFMRSQFLNEEGETDKSWERLEKFNALCWKFLFMGEILEASKGKIPEGLVALMKASMEIEFQKQYDLFAGEYNPEMDRRIAEQQALYERIVPQRDLKRRFLLFFKKKTQNRAANLVDIEADEKAAKVFAEQNARISLRVAERNSAEDLAAEFRQKLAEAFAQEDLRADETPETSPEEQEGQEEPAEELAQELVQQGEETPADSPEEPTEGEEGEEAEPSQEADDELETVDEELPAEEEHRGIDKVQIL